MVTFKNTTTVSRGSHKAENSFFSQFGVVFFLKHPGCWIAAISLLIYSKVHSTPSQLNQIIVLNILTIQALPLSSFLETTNSSFSKTVVRFPVFRNTSLSCKRKMSDLKHGCLWFSQFIKRGFPCSHLNDCASQRPDVCSLPIATWPFVYDLWCHILEGTCLKHTLFCLLRCINAANR